MKFPNLHTVWTTGKNLAIPDTLSRNTPLELLVTDNGTEFFNNEIITLCHLYNIKHEQRTSHVPWTNGLVEGMNRSLQEYLRCIINGNDTRYTEWSTDVKLFPLAYY